MLNGELIFDIDGQVVTINTGDFLVIKPGSTYEMVNASSEERAHAIFSRDLSETDKSSSSSSSRSKKSSRHLK